MKNRQGDRIHMTVSALDVLTHRWCVRIGLFLKTITEHLSAFSNLSEKWRQFHFALTGQIRSPLANCFELFAKQLRCGVRRSRVIHFTNSGKRKKKGTAMSWIQNQRRSKLQTFSFLLAFLRQSPLFRDGV